MSASLRSYQSDLYASAMSALGSNRRVLMQCPTGGGKTIIATAVTEDVSELHQRVWFVCHRAELVHQTSLTFTKAGVAHSFIAAGRPFDPSALVHICSIDTLKARLTKLTVVPDLIILDECHHVGAAGWTAVMAAYPNAYHLGLSATPTRLDGSGLDKSFDVMVNGPAVEWLIEQGYLSPYRVFAPSAPDLSKVKTRAGDYAAGEAEEAMTSTLTGDAIEHWSRHANGLRTVVFAVTVKHSESIVEAFNAAGIVAAHLDGETPRDERATIIQKFAAGEIAVLSNVSLFGEGFDLSAIAGRDVTIDCVVLMRPTQSLSLFLQQVGRALRPGGGKVAVILDHAGNSSRHGLPDDARTWSLHGRAAGAGGDEEQSPPPPVTCKNCFSQIRRPCPALCPHCGAELVIPKELPKVTKGELQELKRAEVLAKRAAKEAAKAAREVAKAAAEAEQKRRAAERKREEWACKSKSELIALGRARDYDYPSAWADRWMAQRHVKFAADVAR